MTRPYEKNALSWSNPTQLKTGIEAGVRMAHEFADRLRLAYGGVTAREVARIHGIEISYDSWRVAGGRVVYFAECSIRPPRIILNVDAIELTAREALNYFPELDRDWFTQAEITEVVIAHELYHILTRQASASAIEPLANEFARRFTGLPFSPARYEVILRQSTREQSSNLLTGSKRSSAG